MAVRQSRRTAVQPVSFSSSAVEWPSQMSQAPRVTRSGKVNSMPSPIQALWAETVGRQLALATTRPADELIGEVEGLIVAIAILWCQPIEQVREELARRVSEA